MRNNFRFFLRVIAGPVFLLFFSGFKNENSNSKPLLFPYQQAGLTKKQAAAHLLSRFSFGATPGQVDDVVKLGLERWFEKQLQAKEPDDSLKEMLRVYDAISMTNQQIVTKYADGGQLLKMAVQDGVLTREQFASLKDSGKTAYRKEILAYMEQKGLQPKAELVRQLINQKILRAAYSKNQLQELLTSFWFNHFNVSLTKNESARFVLGFERDVIRPNVFGKFEDLLLATATSPAMLTYLDNTKSMVAADEQMIRQKPAGKQKFTPGNAEADSTDENMSLAGKIRKARNARGINENYAREIMELHTLGVDGGYTQADVTAGAAILTGWMIYPMKSNGKQAAEKFIKRIGEEKMESLGFVHKNDFLFAANRHDFAAKRFLGQDFMAGEGYQEGLKMLHILATHPSTAHFISRKLAIRFVSDNPPESLVNRMAETFKKEKGDISAVLRSMVSSPEFWSKTALRERIKSPFELVVSTVRATNASVNAPYQLYTWMKKMGEQMYAYQAPTGFPDKSKYWINTGSLLYRMNFGLAFATGRIAGTSYNAAALTNYHEPGDYQAALITYGGLLMPERNLAETQKRLLPLLLDPEIEKKIEAASDKIRMPVQKESDQGMESEPELPEKNGRSKVPSTQNAVFTPVTIMQVIGILIGSPEFQRR